MLLMTIEDLKYIWIPVGLKAKEEEYFLTKICKIYLINVGWEKHISTLDLAVMFSMFLKKHTSAHVETFTRGNEYIKLFL